MAKTNSANRFKLRYQMTVQEFHAFLYVVQSSHWSTRVYQGMAVACYWLIAALIVLPIVFYAPLRQAAIDTTGFYGPPLIIFAVALALMVFHSRILLPAMLRDMLDAYYGGHEIEIDASNAGVVFRCGGTTTKTPWESIERVVNAYGCIFLFTNRSNAVALPGRAFATMKEASRFLAFARKMMKAPK